MLQRQSLATADARRTATGSQSGRNTGLTGKADWQEKMSVSLDKLQGLAQVLSVSTPMVVTTVGLKQNNFPPNFNSIADQWAHTNIHVSG